MSKSNEKAAETGKKREPIKFVVMIDQEGIAPDSIIGTAANLNEAHEIAFKYAGDCEQDDIPLSIYVYSLYTGGIKTYTPKVKVTLELE